MRNNSPYEPTYVDPENNPRHTRKGPAAEKPAPKAKPKASKKKATAKKK